jgi:hypothetical protein
VAQNYLVSCIPPQFGDWNDLVSDIPSIPVINDGFGWVGAIVIEIAPHYSSTIIVVNNITLREMLWLRISFGVHRPTPFELRSERYTSQPPDMNAITRDKAIAPPLTAALI